MYIILILSDYLVIDSCSDVQIDLIYVYIFLFELANELFAEDLYCSFGKQNKYLMGFYIQ